MSITVYLPPAAADASLSYTKRIFLAGSIEMGKAVDWQDALVAHCRSLFPDENICFYNPRRIDWDSSWEQKIDNPEFYGQVTWELDQLECATDIIFYFQPGTLSPISLLELGLHARDKKLYVVCP